MSLNKYEPVASSSRTKSLSVLVLGLVTIGGLASLTQCSAHPTSQPKQVRFMRRATGTEATVVNLLNAGFNESNTVAWDRLAEMTDLYGNRMTGSKAYDKSAEWVVKTVKKHDKDFSVWTEPVWVNRWERGSESLRLYVPTRPNGSVDIPVLALGNSVSTPKKGITAKVIPLGKKVISGNIVLYNFHFTNYGEVVKFRSRGAQEAAKYGALAALVRTATPDSSVASVHTGNSARTTIPAASISPADANLIERLYKRAEAGESGFVHPKVNLALQNTFKENATQSANIIFDLKGSERPDEIVLLSGHFDSWDVGEGRRPKRTVRVVMWNNEETLQRGAQAYFAQHKNEIAKHKFAIESDIGVFEPWGMDVQADQKVIDTLVGYGKDYVKVLGAGNITKAEEPPAEDIAILCEAGVPCGGWLSVNPEGNLAPDHPNWGDHYFRHHHANSDRVEVIDAGQLRRSAAALAAWAYLIADAE
ncbi:Zn-dependent exopeptidase [Linderina pennispora]|uniref:Peptide hydrolase n=1 Tax=Linderina pennispora TaxID=61395 RepID=A0A1Y1W630_9FUNG|nr:Zn-dependent exopeptidase [Linderina pennispora]ORX68979.1 Zn-dependent exopeptidase [Linderina pennispora]